MFDYVSFENRPGKKSGSELKILALSTCGFCKKAVAFLNETGFSYQLLYIDQLPPDTKSRLKEDFFSIFGRKLLFPTLIIDRTEVFPGFMRQSWESRLSSISVQDQR